MSNVEPTEDDWERFRTTLGQLVTSHAGRKAIEQGTEDMTAGEAQMVLSAAAIREKYVGGIFDALRVKGLNLERMYRQERGKTEYNCDDVTKEHATFSALTATYATNETNETH